MERDSGEGKAAQYPILVVYLASVNHSFPSLIALIASVAALCWWCLGKL